jgi:hypothetical protein
LPGGVVAVASRSQAKRVPKRGRIEMMAFAIFRI